MDKPRKMKKQRAKKKMPKITAIAKELHLTYNPQYRSNFQAIKRVVNEFPLTTAHKTELKKTVFWNVFRPFINDEVPKKVMKSDTTVLKILKTYDKVSKKFVIAGKKMMITTRDIQLLFGLPSGKEEMDIDSKPRGGSEFIRRRFENVSKLTATELKKAYVSCHAGTTTIEKQDVARILAIYACHYLFFPTTGTQIPWCFAHYVEDFAKMRRQNWAQAIHKRLVKSLKKNANKIQCVNGCTIALLYWLCEHTSLIKPQKKNVIPRFAKWDISILNKELENRDILNLSGKQINDKQLTPTPNERDMLKISASTMKEEESEDDEDQTSEHMEDEDKEDDKKEEKDEKDDQENEEDDEQDEDEEDDEQEEETDEQEEEDDDNDGEDNETEESDEESNEESDEEQTEDEDDKEKEKEEYQNEDNRPYEEEDNYGGYEDTQTNINDEDEEYEFDDEDIEIVRKLEQLKAMERTNKANDSRIESLRNELEATIRDKEELSIKIESLEKENELLKEERDALCHQKQATNEQPAGTNIEHFQQIYRQLADLKKMKTELSKMLESCKQEQENSFIEVLDFMTTIQTDGENDSETEREKETIRSMIKNIKKRKRSKKMDPAYNYTMQLKDTNEKHDKKKAKVETDEKNETENVIDVEETFEKIVKKKQVKVFPQKIKKMQVYKNLCEDDKKKLEEIYSLEGTGAIIFAGQGPYSTATFEDVVALIEEKEFSSAVIDSYSEILMSRQPQQAKDQTWEHHDGLSYVFTSMCMHLVSKKRESLLKTQVDNELLAQGTSCRYMIFPLNCNNCHWTVLVFDLEIGRWTYYNSLTTRTTSTTDKYMQYAEEMRTYITTNFPSHKETMETPIIQADTPQQVYNSLNCGAICCYIMKQMMTHEKIKEKMIKKEQLQLRTDVIHDLLNDKIKSWTLESYKARTTTEDMKK